jgi:host factor-I protein
MGVNKMTQNLQDRFLELLCSQNIAVTVYLLNGYQIKGVIMGFDNFTIVVSDGTRQDLIYKHAISTITPSRSVNFIPTRDKSENAESG